MQYTDEKNIQNVWIIPQFFFLTWDFVKKLLLKNYNEKFSSDLFCSQLHYH